jgi:hypothetical protein
MTAIADEPPIALQEGVTGPVGVLVTLDAQSSVKSAVVAYSPSVLLNASSIRAAQRSTYQTAISNCDPVASSITVVFHYPVVVPLPTP